MATILSISSQVVRGAVGNSVAGFVLQRLGHTVWQVPTVILSNHPGHGAAVGRATGAAEIEAMWSAIVEHGWHKEVDAVLTGYLPNCEAVHTVAKIVKSLKQVRPDLFYLCDPAIGDAPAGLYVATDAASATRDLLIPQADMASPNSFELSWLTGGAPVLDIGEVVDLTRNLEVPNVVTTSVPVGDEKRIANVLCGDGNVRLCATSRIEDVPKGTGDLFAALYLGAVGNGETAEHALGYATAAVQSVLDVSAGHDELQFVTSQEDWWDIQPLPVEEVAT